MKLSAELATEIDQKLAGFEARALSHAAAKISNRYREAARARPRLLASDIERAAYLATRMPATFAAVSAALQQLKHQMPLFAPRSLLDLGAGPGTAAWASVQKFPTLDGVILVERDALMMQLGRELASASSNTALKKANWIQADLLATNFSAISEYFSKYDLVIFSYAFGELSWQNRSALLQQLWDACAQVLLVVEPGTPNGYQNIITSRSELLRLGAHIIAPCPHQLECPLQKIAGEWCHFAQRLERTSLHRRLKQGELGYEDEKFSYVAVGRNCLAPAPARIIRHPLHAKARIQLQLCAQTGLQSLNLTKSNKESFRAARRSKWGDAWPPLAAEK